MVNNAAIMQSYRTFVTPGLAEVINLDGKSNLILITFFQHPLTNLTTQSYYIMVIKIQPDNTLRSQYVPTSETQNTLIHKLG